MSGMFLKDMYYAHKLTSVGVYNGSFTEMKKQLESLYQLKWRVYNIILTYVFPAEELLKLPMVCIEALFVVLVEVY